VINDDDDDNDYYCCYYYQSVVSLSGTVTMGTQKLSMSWPGIRR